MDGYGWIWMDRDGYGWKQMDMDGSGILWNVMWNNMDMDVWGDICEHVKVFGNLQHILSKSRA